MRLVHSNMHLILMFTECCGDVCVIHYRWMPTSEPCLSDDSL